MVPFFQGAPQNDTYQSNPVFFKSAHRAGMAAAPCRISPIDIKSLRITYKSKLRYWIMDEFINSNRKRLEAIWRNFSKLRKRKCFFITANLISNKSIGFTEFFHRHDGSFEILKNPMKMFRNTSNSTLFYLKIFFLNSFY